MAKDDVVQRWTPLQRTAADFKTLIDLHNKELASGSYLKDLTLELKKLRDRTNLYWLLSFGGAAAILSGGLPTSATVKAFGIEFSAQLLSIQIIAVLMTTAYYRFSQGFLSSAAAQLIVRLALGTQSPFAVQFYTAGADALSLGTVYMERKFIGFKSPRRERLFNAFVVLTSALTTLAHWGLVVLACLVAVYAAWQNGVAHNWYGGDVVSVILGSMSLLVTVVSGLSIIFYVAVPVPYRMSKEDWDSYNQPDASAS